MTFKVSQVTKDGRNLLIAGTLPSPAWQLHGPQVSTTESSIDVAYTTEKRDGFWPQSIKNIRESVDLSNFGSGPVRYRIRADGQLIADGHLDL